ncbi:centrosomal of 192 kDa isoform X1 [Pelobates cultripes]|uniref:Centrosomal of 192 kDa isoform X1 n=1 Tax=Pelobates cultripes TaxID=61616 RepID=A0AAD1RZP9_PELCU|nr:centrosomal of 192 kDa isoform X1 [Pelobates cultripes]
MKQASEGVPMRFFTTLLELIDFYRKENVGLVTHLQFPIQKEEEGPEEQDEEQETFLDLENPGDEEIKWLLSSFAPPYVKGIDQSGDVYRANYTAFRCSRVSGVLAAHAKLKVAISFFPRDRGDYAQYWDLECHPVSEPHLKNKVRFQLCGEGVKDGDLSSRYSADLKTDDPVIPRKRCGSEASTLKIQEEGNRGVFAPQELYTFPPTLIGDSSTLKVNLQNNSFSTYMHFVLNCS